MSTCGQEDGLKVKLRELIEMWGEVAHMGNIDGSLKIESAVRHDCMNDLEEILNGDYSCIERIDS
jgi:hypothetical protein